MNIDIQLKFKRLFLLLKVCLENISKTYKLKYFNVMTNYGILCTITTVIGNYL